MKENAVLLVDADRDCEGIVLEAAARAGRRLQLVTTSREAFASLTERMREIALVIVDVDPGAHGLALLEAIGACAEKPPMVVLTALEQTYMEPIAREHGAVACLGKPISIEKLSVTIQNISAERCVTCDYWGHLVPSRINKTLDVKAVTRGISAKLSAMVAKI
jgi:DNA-binding NtrC family response regulator